MSYYMVNGGRTEAHLEVVAVQMGNHIKAADEMSLNIFQMDCLWYVDFQNDYVSQPEGIQVRIGEV